MKKIKDFSPTIQHYNSDGILMNRYIKWNFVMYMVYACNFFSQIMYKTWVQYLQSSGWGRVCGGGLSTCARLRSSPARGEAHQRVPAVVGTVGQCAPQTVWALRYRQRENSNVCNTGGPLKKNKSLTNYMMVTKEVSGMQNLMILSTNVLFQSYTQAWKH